MTRLRSRTKRLLAVPAATLLLLHVAIPEAGLAYMVNSIVADMRQPASVSGGTSCPQPTRFDISIAGNINRQWSTSLGTNPATILTADQTPAGQLNEIGSTIAQSFGSWTSVPGSALTASSLGPLNSTSVQDACAVDGQNTICFNQSDPAFTTGVLAFSRITTADAIGEQASATSSPSSFVGEILDADILLRPSDPTVTFATPAALSSHPAAYDLESVLTHEIGHLLGFGHSAVWSAVMFPFVPAPGTFLGSRPTPQVPDAPLSGDDRNSGARALSRPVRFDAYRLDQRPRPAGEPPGALWRAGGHNRNLRGAGCRRGCRDRRGRCRVDIRMVLQRSGPARIRRLLQHPAAHSRRQPGLSCLCRAARWAGKPRGRLRGLHNVSQRAH